MADLNDVLRTTAAWRKGSLFTMSQSRDSDPARRFLNAYHGIENILRSRQGAGFDVGFSHLVRSDKLLLAEQRRLLLDLAYLRNAIAHTPYSEAEEPYANPREETVQWIEKQFEIIASPPRVISALKLQPPKTLEASDRLSDFLILVGDPHNFSQVPFRRESGGLGLLTTNAVARWLARQYEDGQGYLADDVSVSGVAESSSEIGDRLIVRSRTLRVVDALNTFAGTSQALPPAAIVVTHSGKQYEKPIGIVTTFDIPLLATVVGI